MRSSGGEERVIQRPCQVGSAADNDWVLADPYVSQHHLLLVPDRGGLRVTDRGSRNGTFLHGARIQEAELRPGAAVVIGQTQIELLPPGGQGQPWLIGESAALRRLRAQIDRVAGLDLPVLLQGESGTGKDVVARALHQASGRPGACVAVNCGALTRELIESELFGHERGAFTGAERRRRGCFAEAAGGTLFLDEVAELPLDLQPRLLRALENRAVRPVGGDREVAVDARVVAATHADLAQAVAQGRFRADLYYRLAALELRLPPLRERPQDVPALVRHFLALLPAGAPRCSVPDEELAALAAYPWPGNVRQLRHAVQRAAYLHGPVLRAADVLDGLPAAPPLPGSGPAVPVLGRHLSEIERDVFAAVLAQTGHNRRAAAALLGIPKSTLCEKVRRMELGGMLRR